MSTGMASSMIELGKAIEEDFPRASETVGRGAIKAGVGHVIGHGFVGEAAGRVSGNAVGFEVAKTVGAGIIGGVGTGVAGMALTAALPFIGLYALGKWIGKKLDE
jgi:hypothetical protein